MASLHLCCSAEHRVGMWVAISSVLAGITENLQMEKAVYYQKTKTNQQTKETASMVLVESTACTKKKMWSPHSQILWSLSQSGALKEEKYDQWGHWQGSCSARLSFKFLCIRIPSSQWFSTFCNLWLKLFSLVPSITQLFWPHHDG